MTGAAAGDTAQVEPVAENLGRRRAGGIYGAIITAAILDTAGGHVSTTALVISVVVTLLVYWIAEEYAEVLGEHTAGGQLPGRVYIQGALADGERVLPAAAGGGAGTRGRGIGSHRCQRRAGGGDRAADGPRMDGWPGWAL